MKMTDDEIYQEIYELSKKTWCEDNLEVKELVFKYSESASQEAKKINESSIIIDTCTFALEDYNWHLSESGVTAINCTVPYTKDGSGGGAMLKIIDYYENVNASDKLMMVYSAADILKAKEMGKVGVIIGAQSCEFVHHNDLYASVEAFARLGLRIMTLAYNHQTFAADGCYTGTDSGLTSDGKTLVDAMEKNGVIVDLSHVGRQSTIDAMKICKKPPIFSHSNPYKLFPHPRNISDEQAIMCAEKGGVIGVSSYNVTLWDKKTYPNINNFADAIDYYVNLVGIDHVGIGLDANAQPGAYERRKQKYFVNTLRKLQGNECLYYKSYTAGRGILTMYTEGLINMVNLVNVTDILLQRGYKVEDIQKILGLNWLRVFKECWD